MILRFERDGSFSGFKCLNRLVLIEHHSRFERECRQIVRVNTEHLFDTTFRATEIADQIVTFGNSVIEFDKIYFWRSAQVKAANAEN